MYASKIKTRPANAMSITNFLENNLINVYQNGKLKIDWLCVSSVIGSEINFDTHDITLDHQSTMNKLIKN